MWLITLRDLQFRRRRFAISVAGTSLVFGLALALAGMSNGFRVEVRDMVDAFGADAWVVHGSAAGPFTSFAALPEETAAELEAGGAVNRVDPVIFLRRDFEDVDGSLIEANLVGHRPGGMGAPPVVEGQAAREPGEVVTEAKLGFDVGRTFTIGGRSMRVVGQTEGLTAFAGVPVIYAPLEDVQAVALGGQAMATAFVVDGDPGTLPPGIKALSNDEARDDLLRPIRNGIESIDQVLILLWILATIVIGALVYLSALERTRDFAVLKALGSSGTALYLGLAAQAMIVALTAALFGAVLGPFMAPMFPLAVVIPGAAFAILPVLALVSGLVASLVAIRRVASVDPALAFGAP